MPLFRAPEPKKPQKEDAFESFVTSAQCLHISTRYETEYGGPYDLNKFHVEYCNDCDKEVGRTFLGQR